MPDESPRPLNNDKNSASQQSSTPPVANRPIEELGLSTRPLRILKQGGVVTIRDLILLRPADFSAVRWRGLGYQSWCEIEERLARLGLSLNYELSAGTEEGGAELGADALSCSVDELAVQEWVKRPLHWSGIHTIGALIGMSPEQLLSVDGFGLGALCAIVAALRERRLFLRSGLRSPHEPEQKAPSDSYKEATYISPVEIVAKKRLAAGGPWWEFKHLGRELLKWKRNELAWECFTRALQEARKAGRACERIYPDLGHQRLREGNAAAALEFYLLALSEYPSLESANDGELSAGQRRFISDIAHQLLPSNVLRGIDKALKRLGLHSKRVRESLLVGARGRDPASIRDLVGRITGGNAGDDAAKLDR